MENKPGVNISPELSGYFDEDEEEETVIPNIEKDDLYFRKLSSSASNTVVPFDKFLPKFWTPAEELLWKKIRKSSFKPWYKEIQGFSRKKSDSEDMDFAYKQSSALVANQPRSSFEWNSSCRRDQSYKPTAEYMGSSLSQITEGKILEASDQPRFIPLHELYSCCIKKKCLNMQQLNEIKLHPVMLCFFFYYYWVFCLFCFFYYIHRLLVVF